ncbi:phosphoserine phosphatase [Kitasatospora cheerisanensis KCTC 2395]|uniref:Phosphoserine phosphatase n=1 Tax=Kitasatospora cheerisanensis KCTC 2395 TaxID=1348663 RepID=A0A066YWU0_9ACTN|nr:phosphoserine phosphatase [Kitasatospora cheerisanensis KCTC 2395]
MSTETDRTLLVKVFGKDRPGITAGLFAELAGFGVEVIDIEQVVTRGRITLCALVTPRPRRAPRAPCG